MKYLILSSFIIVFFIAANAAYALTVTNLDKAPQTLIVKESGEMRQHVIQPNATYHGGEANAVIHLEGRNEVHSMPGDRFTIWPGGELYIQSYGASRQSGNAL